MSEDAHIAVFGSTSSNHKFDFALLALDSFGNPVHYYTVMDAGESTAYICYGGAFPDFRGKGKSFETMTKIIDFLHHKYETVMYSCETTNKPMLKFGIYNNGEITGFYSKDNKLYLEYTYRRK